MLRHNIPSSSLLLSNSLAESLFEENTAKENIMTALKENLFSLTNILTLIHIY